MELTKTMETIRMTLRPIDVRDAQFVCDLFNSAKFLQYIGDRKVRSAQDAEKYIEERMRPGSGGHVLVNYVMIRKEDGAKMGSCGLFDREGLDGVDIGFALLSDYERQGYASEAAFRVRDAAFEEFGMKEIIAITDQRNLASQNLLEKLGMSRVGTTRVPDDETDLYLYRLKRNEWKRR